jgi:MerR family mercuric resistance operon transcriptional regulator
MSTTYTIGSLAKAAAVPVSTLRYYERAGLLVPSHRSAGNYRLYDASDLERLRFIKAAQGSGFTLSDIRVMLGLENGTTTVCEEVQELIQHRLADVAERMKDLRHVQRVLRASLELCHSGSDAHRCEMIEQLIGKSA